MNRRRRATLATAIVSMLAPVGLAVAELDPVSTWPMFGRDSRHTGRGVTNGPTGPVKLAWSYKAPANFKDAPPTIGPDGTIYLSVGLVPICAVNPNGTQKWCTKRIGGGAGGAAPTVGVDPLSPGTGAVIYMGGRDNKTWAVKDHGQNSYTVLWRNKILADGDVHSSALIDPETNAVYSACGCENDGRLLALDPTPADMTDGPGEALWPAAIVTPRILYHSPAQENRRTSPRYRRVYIGSLDGVLHAFSPDDANGQWVKHWSFLPLANGTNTKSSPIIGDDGTIYMGSYLGLSAITDNGSSAENKWPPFLTNERVDATPALSQDGATVYFGISTNPYRFYAVRTATGSEKWHYPRADLGQQRLESFIKVPAVVGLDGTIYVAARRTVYAFRDDGDRATMLWSYRTVGVVLGLSLGTNALFVTANDQKLYKLEDDRP